MLRTLHVFILVFYRHTKKAIDTFKTYFKLAQAGCGPTFDGCNWDLLIPQTSIILNTMCASNINHVGIQSNTQSV